MSLMAFIDQRRMAALLALAVPGGDRSPYNPINLPSLCVIVPKECVNFTLGLSPCLLNGCGKGARSFQMTKATMRVSPLLSVATTAAATAISSSNCTPEYFTAHLALNVSIVYARIYSPDDTFVGPTGNYTGLPVYCAVYVNVSSSAVSYEFGLWLPTESWNKRYMANGNSGFTGQIAFADMAPGINYGFPTVSISTGHNSTVQQAGDASWALNKPETRTD
ncbi:hypothetical protein BBP40_005591 [Aspergillus hancockii]|nr:hypothetical protein BBP40_005591 [Aspergillus hancockii]